MGKPITRCRTSREKITESFDAKVNYQTHRRPISCRCAPASCARRSRIPPTSVRHLEHGGGRATDFAGTGTDTTWSTGANYTRTWSNSFVMEARGGLSYLPQRGAVVGNGLTTSSDVGIRGANIDEWTSGISSDRHRTGIQRADGRLRREPAVGPLRAHRPVRGGVHEAAGEPHDQVRRRFPPQPRFPAADAGQRRAARPVPVPRRRRRRFPRIRRPSAGSRTRSPRSCSTCPSLRRPRPQGRRTPATRPGRSSPSSRTSGR